MAKVTVHEEIEERAAAKPVQRGPVLTILEPDARGRVIKLRELDPLQQSRLVMAVGGENAANQVYMNGFALPAAMVAHIDDDFFGLPGNVKQIDAMLSQLGTDGMAAINAHIVAKFEAAKAEMEKAVQSAEQAAAKN